MAVVRAINRELDRKWSIQDSNWRPYGMPTLQAAALPTMPQCRPLPMGKLTATPVGLIYASINVRAIKEEESPKHLVRPEQLPIYAAPPLRSKYIDEQPGHLQMGFASIRKRVGRYVGWCKGVYVFVKNGITDTVQFGKDAYVYMKNPPRDFLPKIGVITASGLAGVISARKGSRFKKIAYPLGLTTLGATVCYPVQSVIIAKVTVKKAYATSQQIFESVKSWWTKSNKKDSLPEPKEKPKLESSAELEVPGKATRVLTYSVPLSTELNSSETKTKSELPSGATQFLPDPKLMDHGQSHPEDVDMYSTRS